MKLKLSFLILALAIGTAAHANTSGFYSDVFAGQAASTATVIFKWGDTTNPPGTGYNVRRGTTATSCTPSALATDTCTLLNAAPLAVMTYTDALIPVGVNYYYYVQAVSAVGLLSTNAGPSIAALGNPAAPINATCTYSITGGIVGPTNCK